MKSRQKGKQDSKLKEAIRKKYLEKLLRTLEESK